MDKFEFQIEILDNSQARHMQLLIRLELLDIFPNIRPETVNSLSMSILGILFMESVDIKTISLDSVIYKCIADNLSQFTIPNELVKMMTGKEFNKNNKKEQLDQLLQTIFGILQSVLISQYITIFNRTKDFINLPTGFDIMINGERYIPVSERNHEKKTKEINRNKSNHLRLVK